MIIIIDLLIMYVLSMETHAFYNFKSKILNFFFVLLNRSCTLYRIKGFKCRISVYLQYLKLHVIYKTGSVVLF